MQLTIITVLKAPVQGLDRTEASVSREFGDCDQVEHLLKEWTGEAGLREVTLSNGPGHLRRIRLSGQDGGVFDAMLQALERAEGEWVLFLNAGDWLGEGFAPALWEALQACPADCGVLYFDGVTVDFQDGREFPRKAPERLRLQDFYDHVPVLHPCLVLRRSLMSAYGYNCELELAADFDLMVRLVADGVPAWHVNFTGAYMLSGGLSERRRIRARVEATRSLLRQTRSPWQKTIICIRFGRFLMLHVVIVGLVHRLPWLRSWLHRFRERFGGRSLDPERSNKS